ncbi:MAG: ATP-binding protein [Desulfarculaceae bacterium]|nr:ATP-binding protein [Desulfarculaceae bacterium]MCF8046474.1 ATP-binding protein [Desulfarculaceae bacterium]MCF8065895.1 ATP-binding protein [Desulfarculaceae bacterium]MCF8096469.1 ATP-binding protein [Desulfarculaceae bacterium]MCF8121041.1 ATP-binding protein [Desulfarculaceae bacterium]
MPEILVISGKGGTGKTSVTGALAHLAHNKIICDLDVDAPDLHLLLQPQARQVHQFYSGNEAIIDPELCTSCGLCQEKCRFEAIVEGEDAFRVDPLKCEGCKLCVTLCPEEAIAFPQRHCGTWQVSDTRMGPMVHAQLFPGQENSGRLVALLRQHARELSRENGYELILSDGPPGIGCPVISSMSGTDLAVVVTEPTPSGRHDLERVLELCRHFKVPAGVIINKCDLNLDQSKAIADYCAREGLELLAELPFDPAMVRAMVQGQVITEYQQNGLAEDLAQAWEKIIKMADAKKAA